MEKKTKEVFIYLTPKNHGYAKEMRPLFKSVSEYINLLVATDRKSERLKRKKLDLLKRIKKLESIDLIEEK